MKACARQPVAIIQRRIAQELSTLGVDEKFHAFLLHNGIPGLLCIERHLILEARATALGDLHTQAFALPRGMRFEQGMKLADGVLCDVDHLILEIRALQGQVKPQSGSWPLLVIVLVIVIERRGPITSTSTSTITITTPSTSLA